MLFIKALYQLFQASTTINSPCFVLQRTKDAGHLYASSFFNKYRRTGRLSKMVIMLEVCIFLLATYPASLPCRPRSLQQLPSASGGWGRLPATTAVPPPHPQAAAAALLYPEVEILWYMYRYCQHILSFWDSSSVLLWNTREIIGDQNRKQLNNHRFIFIIKFFFFVNCSKVKNLVQT